MRRSRKQREQIASDDKLRIANTPTAYQASNDVKPASDSAYKVYAGRMEAMKDKKLTFEAKSNPTYKERNKKFKPFS